MFEEDVKKRLEAIFPNQNIEIDHRLLGGMSNYTYVVKINGEMFTYRIPGDNSDKFVDRSLEKENLKLVNQLNISNQTVYFDLETGEKLARYVDGQSVNLLQEYPYELISESLKKIHNSRLKATNDYDPFARLSYYEEHVKELGFVHSKEYIDIKKKFFEYKEYLESQEKVLCHGDSQPSNFIYDGKEVYVVDFEFTGNNDICYDIACFANVRLEEGLKLLEVYFNKPNQDQLKRFYLWRTFQCFQWYNVATFKDLVGMSASLKIDFKMVSDKYLALIYKLMDIIENKL